MKTKYVVADNISKQRRRFRQIGLRAFYNFFFEKINMGKVAKQCMFDVNTTDRAKTIKKRELFWYAQVSVQKKILAELLQGAVEGDRRR